MGTLSAPMSLPYADINQQRFAAFPNAHLKNKDGSQKSKLDHLIDYAKSADGVFRIFKLLEGIAKIAAIAFQQMGSAVVGFFDGAAKKFATAWQFLIIPRLPVASRDAKAAMVNWSILSPGVTNEHRDKIQKTHDIAEGFAAWGYAVSLFFANPAILNMANVSALAADTTEVDMSARDWSQAREYRQKIDAQGGAPTEIQRRIIDTQKLAFLKMVKSVTSVAGGIFGLLLLAFGGPLVPALALILLSLISTIAAMSSHFFKEAVMPYQPIEFHKIRQPQVLVSGSPAA